MKNNRIILALVFFITTITLLSFQRKEIEQDIKCRLESVPMQAINIETFHKYVAFLYRNGNLEKELTKITESAKSYIVANTETYKGKKTAIVFDLDETLLSNFDSFKKNNFAIEWDK